MFTKIYNDNNDPIYEVDKSIKSGGFGTVYLGKDIINNTTVAIKIISVFDSNYLDALKRELRIATELTHKNIIKTFDSGFDQVNNQLYIVMEYVPEGSLDVILNRKEFIPINDCLRMFRDVLFGLEYAHTKIVHRDLKPSNILVNSSGDLLLCDFGLAKYVGDTTFTFSYKGVGTYAYMSPEAWSNEQNTPIMDIYSLGIIFYEILALKKPFNAITPMEYKDLHLFEPLPDISLLRNDVPVKLKEIIVKMTNKRRHLRYQNVTDILTSLGEVTQQMNEANETANRIASLAHGLLTKQNAKIAEREKQQNDIAQKVRTLNFSITEMFAKIKTIVTSTNSRLEHDKITIVETKNRDGLYELTLKFMSKTLSIDFFGISDVQNYSEERNESRQRQIQQYDDIVSSPGETTLEKEKVVLVGKMQINNGTMPYSLNLILRKVDQNDNYGEWSYGIFKDSALTQRNIKQDYGLDRNSFYKEYDICRRAMHVRSVKVEKLEDMDIETWLQIMMT